MAQFILTAKQTTNRGTGWTINKGDTITLDIFRDGIKPNNLLSHEGLRDSIQRQFESKGLPIKKGDRLLTDRSLWNIEKI